MRITERLSGAKSAASRAHRSVDSSQDADEDDTLNRIEPRVREKSSSAAPFLLLSPLLLLSAAAPVELHIQSSKNNFISRQTRRNSK